MKPLNRQFNVAVLHIADQLHPRGWAVSDAAPGTLEQINESIASGRITVWSGGSEHTIFGDREINYAFRAWHDWCHWHGQFPFTRSGEEAAARMQQSHIRKLYGRGKIADEMCRIIWAEVVGQLSHQEDHGDFPIDQAGFVAAYLADSGKALSMRW